MKKLARASLFIIILIAGCSTSSNDSLGSISITATQPTAWEGSGDYIEFVIDLGSPNETDGTIIVYFDASGTALDRNDIEANTDLLNGYVEIPPSQSHHHKAIRIGGFTSDGNITQTQTITLRITGCSSAEYPIGPLSEATAIVMDGDGERVTDIDGNVYHTVLIGTQTWMVENLKTERDRGGYYVRTSWSYDDPDKDNSYGLLYDWSAVTSPYGLAPAGWHIPSDNEWQKLFVNLRAGMDVGKKLKSSYGWLHNGNGTNESGFTALPGGYRDYYGKLSGIGEIGHWWSSTRHTPGSDSALTRVMQYNSDSLFRNAGSYDFGFSVRCVKD